MTPTLALLIGMVASAQGADSTPQARLKQVVDGLRDRHATLLRMSCEFTHENRGSAAAIAQYARDMKLSREDAADRLAWTFDARFDETSEGQFRLETRRQEKDGTVRRILSYDGKDYWTVDDSGEGEDVYPGTAAKGVDGRREYELATIARTMLGDTVLPVEGLFYESAATLHLRVERSDRSEILPDEQIDGVPCVVLRWEKRVNGTPSRESVWLDERRGLALLRYEEAYLPAGQDEWVTSRVYRTREMTSTTLKLSGGETTPYWYPRVVDMELRDPNQEVIAEGVCTIRTVALNPAFPTDHFTPNIEDGTRYHDTHTGSVTVYGGGPSPRLKRLTNQRIQESKQMLESRVATQPAHGTQAPPPAWSNYVSWVALTLGACGLVVALVLLRRRA